MTLYVTDDELIERLGVPEKIAKQALSVLDHDRNSHFPKKEKIWGDRRYWPAVIDYFEKVHGLPRSTVRYETIRDRRRIPED